MALVGAGHTVDPFVRTPEEVLEALFGGAPADESPPARPWPCFKYVRAALQRDDADSTAPQVQTIFGWMAQQVAQRNPESENLHGEISAVIRSLRWLGTHRKLKGKRRDTLESVCGYLHNNLHPTAYDVYLEHGFSIASGVIEGACRCVVKDRMERSGMRWVMTVAASMLDLRCIYSSDLCEEFKTFRIERESRRLYPGYAANDPDFSQQLVA